MRRGHIRHKVRHRAQLVLWGLPPLQAVQHAHLVLLVHIQLRLDQRAAWIALSDNQHYHLELHAGSVQLDLTLLELGHNAYIALLGHMQVPQDKRRVNIVK